MNLALRARMLAPLSLGFLAVVPVTEVLAQAHPRPSAQTPIDGLVALLADAEHRHAAHRLLVAAGAAAVEELLEVVRRMPQTGERTEHGLAAVGVLRGIGPGAVTAVSALRDCLKPRDPQLDEAALLALAEVGPYAANRPELHDFLVDNALDGDRRHQHRYGFVRAGLIAVSQLAIDPATPTAELLTTVRRDANPAKVIWAARLLSKRSAEADRIALGLRDAIRRDYEGADIRYDWPGPGVTGHSAVGTKGNAYARPPLALAIAKLHPNGPFPPLAAIELLAHGNAAQRLRAAFSLGQERVAAAVPALQRALHDSDARLLAEAVTALGLIGRPARAAEPRLVQLTNHAQRQIAERARAALAAIREPRQP